MIVIDCSAVIEAIAGRTPSHDLLRSMTAELHAPHLLDTEVMSALRGLALSGKLPVAAAERALGLYRDLDITRHGFAPLSTRVWQLRHQFTSYDASYLALAEALDAPLVTCDAKLETSGHRACVHVAPRG